MAYTAVPTASAVMMLVLLLGAYHASAAFNFTDIQNASVSVADVLTLDSTALASYADALFALPPAASISDLSFTTFFTFSSSTGGWLAFVITPDSDLPARYPSLLTATSPSSSNISQPPDVSVMMRNSTSASGLLLPIFYIAYGIKGIVNGADINQAVEYEVSVEYNAARNESIARINMLPSAVIGIAINNIISNVTVDLSPLLLITNSSYLVGLLSTGGGMFNVSQWNFTTQGTATQIVQAQLDLASPPTQPPNSSPSKAASALSPSRLIAHTITLSLAAALFLSF